MVQNSASSSSPAAPAHSSPTVQRTTEALIQALRVAADAEQTESMARYMRDQFQFLGVKTPARRQATKAILATAVKAFGKTAAWGLIHGLWQQPEREFQYVACDYLAAAPALSEDDLDRLRQLITTKSWWDTVDPLSTVLGRALRAGSVEKRAIEQWSQDDNLWVRRAAIICQRGFQQDTDPELLADTITANVGSGEFFIDKAIGWALRDYSKTNPDWVRGFLRAHRPDLSALSVREASRYL